MRWLFVGDLHFNLHQMEWLEQVAGGYDAVVCTGDMLDVGGHRSLGAQRRIVQDVLTRLSEKTVVAAVSGNHDVDKPGGGAGWLQEIKGPRLFVDGSTVTWSDTALTLWPWAAGLAGGAGDGVLGRRGGDAMLPYWHQEHAFETWIWVHHAPPADTRVSRCRRGGPLAGNRRLVERIRRHRPSLVVSGHLHEAPYRPGGRWWDCVGDTLVVNAGHDHGEMPPHVVLDLDAGELTWITATARDAIDFVPGARLAGVA